MRMLPPLLLATVTIAGAPAHATDLIEIYAQALTSDPQLREAEASLQATLQRKPQAIAALLPQVSAGWTYDDNKNNTRAIRGVGSVVAPSITDTTSDGWGWSVDFTQTLFRADQWLRVRQADKEAAQSEADYQAARQNVITRVATAYFDVLAAQDTLESEQAAKEAIGRQLEQAQKRFEVGLIAITDVQEAQAGYDEAVAAEITAKRVLANRREVLREITGQYTPDLDGPQEEIPLVSPNPVDENQWVEIALQQNLSLMSADIAVDIARDDVRIARSAHLPTLDLVARRQVQDISGGGHNTAQDFNDPTIIERQVIDTLNDSTSEVISLQFSVPIYAGGAIRSQSREAVWQRRAALERLERTAREVERQTRDSYLGVISEIARVKALRQALKSAQTALQATEAGFEVGTRTTVDVLDARRQLFLAETNYARSRYDYIVNVLLLKEAAGTLNETDVAEVNGWLE
ncbi:MAG: TolC family outer membrane protein [Chromatiales bacterium]|nr:MAG: TolC family outer membrane protein [Chromatiales bacterium]